MVKEGDGMEMFPAGKPIVTALDAVFYHKGDGLPHDYDGRLSMCELIYKVSGDTVVQFGEQTLHEKAGDLRFLPSGRASAVYHIEPMEPGSSIYFRFMLSTPFPDKAFLFTPANPAAFQLLFERLHHTWLLGAPGYYAESMALVYRIIALMEEQQSAYLPGTHTAILDRATPYLEEHCFDPEFDYTALSRAAGVSYSYYKRLFLKRHGVTPSRFILSLRMRRATELLSAGMFSVAEVAAATGFTDAAYFSRVFRRELGVAPSQYMKKKSTST